MTRKIEYHDTCPVCKNQMQGVDKDNKKAIFYYCKKCKQKYRVYTSYKSQFVNCPHCKKTIRLLKLDIDTLHMNTFFNFDVKKVKVWTKKK